MSERLQQRDRIFGERDVAVPVALKDVEVACHPSLQCAFLAEESDWPAR